MILDQKATVYSYETNDRLPITTTLSCRMVHLSVRPATTAQDRDELAARRKLLFDASFNMPEIAQVQVNGDEEVWNTVVGTFAKMEGPSRLVKFRHCELVRAGDG